MRSTSARRICPRRTIRTRTSDSSRPRTPAAPARWLSGRRCARTDALGYREMIERHVRLARHLADRVDDSPDLERLADVPLNIVCFRAHPPGFSEEQLNELNTRLGDALRADGRVFVGTTTYAGKTRAATRDRQLAHRHSRHRPPRRRHTRAHRDRTHHRLLIWAVLDESLAEQSESSADTRSAVQRVGRRPVR